MATIYNNIDRVAGDPQNTAQVKIQLLWDKTVSPVARDSDDDVMIQGYYVKGADENGHWETDLVPNLEILPADSVYRITEIVKEVLDDFKPTETTYYITVPDSVTPAWTGDLILTSLPGWL